LVDIIDIVHINIFYLSYLCLIVIYTCIILYYKYIDPMYILDTREINSIQFFSIFNTSYVRPKIFFFLSFANMWGIIEKQSIVKDSFVSFLK